VALLLRKPVYLLNVGLSRPVTRYGQKALKWLLPRCRGIVVRDLRSFEICHEYAATGHLQLVPDIVRRLPDLLPSSAAPGLIARTTVLVALHGDSNVYGRYQMTETRIDIFAGLLDSIVSQYGLNVDFLPFQPENDGGDVNIARKVLSRMRHSSSARILEWTLEVPEIAARYRRSRLVIAMRLHAAILAATYGTPCVIMPYDQKVVEFGKQAQIPYSLTPALLDKPVMALEMLSSSLAGQVAPAPLQSSGDWMQLTLSSLSQC
jgi:polysaccharide pyruvyl transferase WcaK-like protein